MNERPTPETDALAERLIPLAENITASNAQNVIKQLLIEILTKTTALERERDEARQELLKLKSPKETIQIFVWENGKYVEKTKQ